MEYQNTALFRLFMATYSNKFTVIRLNIFPGSVILLLLAAFSEISILR